MHVVMDLADRVMVLDFGVVIAPGPPADVQADPNGHRGIPGAATTSRDTVASRAAAAALRASTPVASRSARSTSVAGGRSPGPTTRPRRARSAPGLRAVGVGRRRSRRHTQREPARVAARRRRRAGHRRGQRRHLPDQPGDGGRVPARATQERGRDRRGRGAARQGARGARPPARRSRGSWSSTPRGVRELDDPMVMTFAELEELGRTQPVAGWGTDLGGDSVAMIVYTSGTTGPPKGAMLSHANLRRRGRHVRRRFHHRARRRGALVPAAQPRRRAAAVAHRRAERRLRRELRRGRRVVRGRPARDPADVLPRRAAACGRRCWPTVEIRMADASRLKRFVYRRAMAMGRRSHAKRMRGAASARSTASSRALVAAAVPQPPREARPVAACASPYPAPRRSRRRCSSTSGRSAFPCCEGYGQTEGTALATYMPADDVRIGKVGKALPGVELRIADDGEILVRSKGVFAGYLDNARPRPRRRSTPTAGCTPATSARSTATASCPSPTARRTSSSPPAARTSRRRRSRTCSRCRRTCARRS